MSRNGSREISSTRSGLSTSIFIRSTRLVPPARNDAPGAAAIASFRSEARRKVKRRMSDVPRGGLDRGQDVGVRAAAAEVARHPLADVVVVRRLPLVEQRDGGEDLTRGAIAALERVLLEERELHRVQLAAPRQALDGGDAGAVQLRDELQAGVHPLAVDDHGASPALPQVAALLGAGEAQVLPQGVEQDDARLDAQGAGLAVHQQAHFEKVAARAVAAARPARPG